MPWLLTTRNRQAMCQEVLDACEKTKMSTPGIIWCDGCEYPNLRFGPNWARIETHEHRNIGHAYRRFTAAYPEAPWYGWMTDDCPPLSEGWDKALVEAAGDWWVAYPDDGWQQGRKESDGTPHVTSICCIGGKLVRAMGGMALPGQIQMFIDDFLEAVAVPLGLMNYRSEVKSEHKHFANGKRAHDATDTRMFRGIHFPTHDRAVLEAWIGSGEAERTRARVAEQMWKGD